MFEVAAAMTERGEVPSILSAQAAIGGGSYSTVKRYLDVWKETERQRRDEVALPDAAIERLMVLGRDFWALLEARTAREVEQIRAAAKEETGLLIVQLRQVEEAIAKLEHERELHEQVAAERETADQAPQSSGRFTDGLRTASPPRPPKRLHKAPDPPKSAPRHEAADPHFMRDSGKG